MRDFSASRFIPACAGNGSAPPLSLLLSPVHPRVCGERRRGRRLRWRDVGSSPRVRGTAVTTRQDESKRRFIPACAGNGLAREKLHIGDGSSPRVRGTAWRARSSTSVTVHPRVCGERTR